MRSFLVVDPEPGVAYVAHLLEILEHVGVEHLLAETAVEAFDVGVLVGFPGLNGTRFDAVSLTPVEQFLGNQLGAVIHA